jgi:hypothetical protein
MKAAKLARTEIGGKCVLAKITKTAVSIAIATTTLRLRKMASLGFLIATNSR